MDIDLQSVLALISANSIILLFLAVFISINFKWDRKTYDDFHVIQGRLLLLFTC
jgi:hypothetical protein